MKEFPSQIFLFRISLWILKASDICMLSMEEISFRSGSFACTMPSSTAMLRTFFSCSIKNLTYIIPSFPILSVFFFRQGKKDYEIKRPKLLMEIFIIAHSYFFEANFSFLNIIVYTVILDFIDVYLDIVLYHWLGRMHWRGSLQILLSVYSADYRSMTTKRTKTLLMSGFVFHRFEEEDYLQGIFHGYNQFFVLDGGGSKVRRYI